MVIVEKSNNFRDANLQHACIPETLLGLMHVVMAHSGMDRKLQQKEAPWSDMNVKWPLQLKDDAYLFPFEVQVEATLKGLFCIVVVLL